MKTIRFALGLGLMLASAQFVSAQSFNIGCADSGCASQGACCNEPTCCPNCHATCVFEAKMVKVDKSCYEVECKPICVPRVRFPWQKCCEPVCADIKYVKVLKVKKYECEECEYSWKVDEQPCSCGGCESMGIPASAIPTPAVEEPAAAEGAAQYQRYVPAQVEMLPSTQGRQRNLPTAAPIRQVSGQQATTSKFEPVYVQPSRTTPPVNAESARRRISDR